MKTTFKRISKNEIQIFAPSQTTNTLPKSLLVADSDNIKLVANLAGVQPQGNDFLIDFKIGEPNSIEYIVWRFMVDKEPSGEQTAQLSQIVQNSLDSITEHNEPIQTATTPKTSKFESKNFAIAAALGALFVGTTSYAIGSKSQEKPAIQTTNTQNLQHNIHPVSSANHDMPVVGDVNSHKSVDMGIGEHQNLTSYGHQLTDVTREKVLTDMGIDVKKAAAAGACSVGDLL